MQSVDYSILAYTSSETIAAGVDLLVLIRLKQVVGPCLRAFLLNNWRNVASDADQDAINYIEAVIYDLRQYLVLEDATEVDAFFKALSSMSVGPLRTSASGFCTFPTLNNLPFAIGDNTGELISLAPDVLRMLLGDLATAERQLQATRT